MILRTPFTVGDQPLLFRRDELLLTTEGHVILSGSPELRGRRVHGSAEHPRPRIVIPFPPGQGAGRAPTCEATGMGLWEQSKPLPKDASCTTTTRSNARTPGVASQRAAQTMPPFRTMLGVTQYAMGGGDGRQPLALARRMRWEPGDVVLAECALLPVGVNGAPVPRERWGASLAALVQTWRAPFFLPAPPDIVGTRRPAVCRSMDTIQAPSVALHGVGAELQAALLQGTALSERGDGVAGGAGDSAPHTRDQPPLLAWKGTEGAVHVRARGSAQGADPAGPTKVCGPVALAEPAASGCEAAGKGAYRGSVVVAWRGGCSFATMLKHARAAGAAALVVVDRAGIEAHAEHLMGGEASAAAGRGGAVRQTHACRADGTGGTAATLPPLLMRHGPLRLPTVLVAADVGCVVAAVATAPVAAVLRHRAQCEAAVGTCAAGGEPWPRAGSASAPGHRPGVGRGEEALELCLHMRREPSGP